MLQPQLLMSEYYGLAISSNNNGCSFDVYNIKSIFSYILFRNQSNDHLVSNPMSFPYLFKGTCLSTLHPIVKIVRLRKHLHLGRFNQFDSFFKPV